MRFGLIKFITALILSIGVCILLTTINQSVYHSNGTPVSSADVYNVHPMKTVLVNVTVDIKPNWCNVTRNSRNSRGGKKKRFPDAIIIGAKKCGTSSLLQMLLAHPLIDGPPYEVYFFSASQLYDKGLEWYLSRMPPTSPDQITIEKTPGYFTSDMALNNIYGQSSTVKILLIIRDPIIRSVSDYAWRLSVNTRTNKSTSSYEHYIFDDHTQKISTRPSEIKVSLYDVYYQKWVEKFGRERIHIVNGDELIRNPVSELHRIETFLDIPHYFSKDIFSYNETKGFYCWRRYDSTGECTKPNLECMNSHNGRKHPEVSEASLRQVKNFLIPHIRNFCRSILPNVTFSWCLY